MLLALALSAAFINYYRNGMPWYGVLHIHLPPQGWTSARITQNGTSTLQFQEGQELRKHMDYGWSRIIINLNSGKEIELNYFHCDIRVRRRVDLYVHIDKQTEELTCYLSINGKSIYNNLPVNPTYNITSWHEHTRLDTGSPRTR